MTAFTFDAKLDSFEADVINASKDTPVLVDFWAQWCGPCKQLGPVLEKLADEFNGGFLLAKVDVDAEQQLAGYFQIKSIPTVMLLKDGKIVDGFPGALTETQLREFLAHHQIIAKPALEEIAVEVETALDPQQEVTRLRKAMAETPQDDNLKLELGLALAATHASTEALALFDALPANLALDERVRKARARFDLAKRLIDAPAISVLKATLAANPSDAEALKNLGLCCIAAGDSETGLQHLFTLFRDHRQFQEGLPRTLLIEAFDMLDDEDLVRAYRRKMASLLN